ncbi:MAG: YqeG family HAD IIIA-type phosphatase [Lachnospiraceae bacterium]
MSNILYPDEYLESAYQINFRQLYHKGYRGVIFDIDNTLVPHGAPADARSITLISDLKKMGYQVVLMSNNRKERVKSFQKNMRVPYIWKAGKPNPKNYRRSMRIMKTNHKNTLFVGDQIFTDISGANLAKIRTILVKPINPQEEIQIVLKRYLERIVLLFYKRRLRKRTLHGSRKELG